METNVEGPTPDNFSADATVQLWWADCMRRPNQRNRKEYRSKIKDSVTESSESGSELEEFALDDWDRLFAQ